MSKVVTNLGSIDSTTAVAHSHSKGSFPLYYQQEGLSKGCGNDGSIVAVLCSDSADYCLVTLIAMARVTHNCKIQPCSDK